MCGSATWWAKLALLCMVLALMLHIGGWASDNWMTYQSSQSLIEQDIGLWQQKNCSAGECERSVVSDEFVTDEFNVVRGLETVGLVMVIVLSILLTIYVCVEGTRVLNFAIFLVVVCFLAGLCCLVGIFIWVATVPSPYVPSYSMGLTVLACTLILLAGTLMVPEILDKEESYRAPSRAVSPYTPRREGRTVITPISYRGSYGGGGGYRW